MITYQIKIRFLVNLIVRIAHGSMRLLLEQVIQQILYNLPLHPGRKIVSTMIAARRSNLMIVAIPSQVLVIIWNPIDRAYNCISSKILYAFRNRTALC